MLIKNEKDICKKCKLLREDHHGFWKVTDCKFEEKEFKKIKCGEKKMKRIKFEDNRAWKLLDNFLLNCPEISQDEREEIMELIE